MKATQKKPVIVIGAGPAGLSIGYELLRRGIDFVILEKGSQAGESFAHYPKHIFFGPWLNNTLPGSNVPWTWKLRRATQPAYTWYLGQYAQRHAIPIRTGVRVHDVRRGHDGFILDTSQGEMECRYLVNCSGYFSSPHIPAVEGLHSTTITWMHSSDYREANDLVRKLGRSRGRVLVVGAGLTGGETMVELHKTGFQVALSHRGRLIFGPSPFQEAVLSPINSLIEKVAISLDIRLNSNPPMAGGESQRLIGDGSIKTYPPPLALRDGWVDFANGTRAPFDAVVFATGYEYTRGHLHSLLPDGPIEVCQMESMRVSGLFFLGLDQQRTYRSRFLRGIRADARILGELLGERLTETQGDSPPLTVPLENKTFIDLESLPDSPLNV